MNVRQKLIMLFVAGVLCACNSSGTSDTGPPSGKNIYTIYCRTCHGSEGNAGINNAADLSKTALTREEAIHVVTDGRNTMASFDRILDKEEIEAVVDYLLSFQNR